MNERWQTAFLAVGVCVLAALGVTPLIAVFRLGTDLTAGWIVLVFQIVIAALGVCVGTGLAYYVTQYLVLTGTDKALEKIEDLRRDHQELLNKAVLRVPPFAVGMLLIAQAVVYLADKSFERNVGVTVSLTLVLIVVFWLANELATRTSAPQRRLGICLWVAAVLLLPVMIIIDRNGDLSLVWQQFRSLSLQVKSVAILTLIAALLAPYAVWEQRRSVRTEKPQ
jgi:hypothetical protein